jgi:excisionase family DNA binding protein
LPTAKQQRQEIWLSVEDAATRLGIKPRRMLDYKATIRSRYVDNPKSGKEVLMFEEADVERLVAERKHVVEVGLARIAPAIAERGNGAMTASPYLPMIAAPSAHARAWLTLAEAAEYSGLPDSFLLGLIDGGKLPACNVGVRPGSRYRVKRADLDAIAGEQCGPSS